MNNPIAPLLTKTEATFNEMPGWQGDSLAISLPTLPSSSESNLSELPQGHLLVKRTTVADGSSRYSLEFKPTSDEKNQTSNFTKRILATTQAHLREGVQNRSFNELTFSLTDLGQAWDTIIHHGEIDPTVKQPLWFQGTPPSATATSAHTPAADEPIDYLALREARRSHATVEGAPLSMAAREDRLAGFKVSGGSTEYARAVRPPTMDPQVLKERVEAGKAAGGAAKAT